MIVLHMGAGTWGAGWATAHPGKNQEKKLENLEKILTAV